MSLSPRHQAPAPSGYVWLNEASRLTGLSRSTLYNYRHLGIGPPSATYRSKAVYKLTDIEAWIEAEMIPTLDSQRQRDSRPPTPRRAPRRQ